VQALTLLLENPVLVVVAVTLVAVLLAQVQHMAVVAVVLVVMLVAVLVAHLSKVAPVVVAVVALTLVVVALHQMLAVLVVLFRAQVEVAAQVAQVVVEQVVLV
jgi:hypothetical protein